MPPESRGIFPYIHRNIEHRALHHAHQFALRMLDLIVESAQHILSRARVVVLHEIHITASQLGELAPIETFKKETAIITKYFGFDDQQVGDGGMNQFHSGTPFSLSTRIK